ncbi:hypothetical protein THOM_1861 [Trachipleistophora hominis]|uniref:Uncharacterized protein n=1 Tax=Trachipleistophora hominis TaxID=72359 RepID=L7JUU6_TRAHO|nr:hypothetical protein THOM_1861 [Trachipleistophora hominis]
MLINVLIQIVCAAEGRLDAYSTTISKKLVKVVENIETMHNSNDALEKLRKMDKNTIKNAQKLYNTFQTCRNEFASSSGDLKCYIRTVACALDLVNLTKQLVTVSEIKDVDLTVYDVLKTTFRDKKVLAEYCAGMGTDEEKTSKFKTTVSSVLDKLGETLCQLDMLCFRILNDMVVDVCLLRSILSRHTCKMCEIVPTHSENVERTVSQELSHHEGSLTHQNHES